MFTNATHREMRGKIKIADINYSPKSSEVGPNYLNTGAWYAVLYSCPLNWSVLCGGKKCKTYAASHLYFNCPDFLHEFLRTRFCDPTVWKLRSKQSRISWDHWCAYNPLEINSPFWQSLSLSVANLTAATKFRNWQLHLLPNRNSRRQKGDSYILTHSPIIMHFSNASL